MNRSSIFAQRISEMGLSYKERRRHVRGITVCFLCIKLRNRQGYRFRDRECIINALIEWEGVSDVKVGDRDISMYVYGMVSDKMVMGMKQSVGKAIGVKKYMWAVGYYLATVGNVDVEAYKSYIAGL